MKILSSREYEDLTRRIRALEPGGALAIAFAEAGYKRAFADGQFSVRNNSRHRFIETLRGLFVGIIPTPEGEPAVGGPELFKGNEVVARVLVAYDTPVSLDDLMSKGRGGA